MRGNVVKLFARYPNSAFVDFTQSAIPLRALPYATGETYKFIRESTVLCPAYDTATQSLKWVEIPANVPPMPGMRWDSVNNLWSPYDDNGVLIPGEFRKGYWYLPQATNSIAYSRDFMGAGWISLYGITIARNATGFDGTPNTAWTFTADNTVGPGLSQTLHSVNIPADTSTHLGVTRVKKDDITTRVVGVIFGNVGTAVRTLMQINTKTGEYATLAGGNGAGLVIDDGDWWVVVQTITNDSSQTALKHTLIPASGRDINTIDNTAEGSAVFDQSEIRLNTSFYDGSPIVTNGSALTRLRGDYQVSINNHNQSAGMVLCEFDVTNPTSDIAGSGNCFLVNTQGPGDRRSVLYFTSSNFQSYDGTTVLASSAGPALPGITNKAAVRWSGTNRAIVIDGVENAGAYDGKFTLSDDSIIIGYDNPISFYLKSLKYYNVDRGTAWIQGQQS